MIERIIGIDFGTSTSVVRVKRYNDGKPLTDIMEAKAVTFNMGNAMLPTLIQETDDGLYYGFDATVKKKNEYIHQNFKLDLENDNVDIRAKARQLTRSFLEYMSKAYRDQSEGGHLGNANDVERTIVSYPVKWSADTKTFMVEAAKKAGFPNVEGMDEATAAINAVMVQNSDLLRQKGYFTNGKPVNLLLIDMGAGTTDLVLCRHTPGANGKTEILNTYPKDGNVYFGGNEFDAFLLEYIRSRLPEGSQDIVLRNCGLKQFKEWKEAIVSPALLKKETVTYCAPIDQILSIMNMEMASYALDRREFEICARGTLEQFPRLVKGCLEEVGMAGSEVDLVILTGGHSQWYFVRELLTGVIDGFEDIGLEKIKANPDRILSISLPQETVALGLVYSQMHMDLEAPASAVQLKHIEGSAPDCIREGSRECWVDPKSNKCFLDEKGSIPVSVDDIKLPALGHSYRPQDQFGRTVLVCARCGAVSPGTPKSPEKKAAHEEPVRRQTVMSDDTLTPENEFELGNIGEEYYIKKYIGKRKRVIIPGIIRNRKVIMIGVSAFYNAKITYVCVPDTVTRICAGCFSGCKELQTVKMHSGIKRIDQGAFLFCKSLKYVDFGVGEPREGIVFFPKELAYIGAQAFMNANILTGKYVDILKEVTISRKTVLDKKSRSFPKKKLLENPAYEGKYTILYSSSAPFKECAIFYYEDSESK